MRRTACAFSRLPIGSGSSPLSSRSPGWWDWDRFGQILDNLLENAAKYADDESEIIIAVSRAGNEARISVPSRGPGIAPAELSRLFDRFYRVGDMGAASGLGLGLYIS